MYLSRRDFAVVFARVRATTRLPDSRVREVLTTAIRQTKRRKPASEATSMDDAVTLASNRLLVEEAVLQRGRPPKLALMRSASRLDGFRIVAIEEGGRTRFIAEKDGQTADAALDFYDGRSATPSERKAMERVVIGLWFALRSLEKVADAKERRGHGHS